MDGKINFDSWNSNDKNITIFFFLPWYLGAPFFTGVLLILFSIIHKPLSLSSLQDNKKWRHFVVCFERCMVFSIKNNEIQS